jgi:hypothetical protein
MVGIGVVSVIKERCITETIPKSTIYDEVNIIKERCITETTPIPTIYDEENVIKEYSVMQRSLITFSSS